MRFEFKVIEIPMEATFPALADQLNTYGKLGWQVVAASDRLEKGIIGQRGQFIIILQRAIGAPENTGLSRDQQLEVDGQPSSQTPNLGATEAGWPDRYTVSMVQKIRNATPLDYNRAAALCDHPEFEDAGITTRALLVTARRKGIEVV